MKTELINLSTYVYITQTFNEKLWIQKRIQNKIHVDYDSIGDHYHKIYVLTNCYTQAQYFIMYYNPLAIVLQVPKTHETSMFA